MPRFNSCKDQGCVILMAPPSGSDTGHVAKVTMPRSPSTVMMSPS